VTRRQGLILPGVTAALVAAACATAALSHASDWEPAALVGLLLVLCIGSDAMTVEVRNVRITGSFLAIVLAMALLGPAPAAVIGGTASLVDAIIARRPIDNALMNIANYMIFPLIGGVMIHETVGHLDAGAGDGLNFAALVLVVFMVTNFINFTLVALFNKAKHGTSYRQLLTTVYKNVLPSEFAAALFTAGVAFSYDQIGVGAVGIAAVVLFVIQYLLRTGVDAFERGELLSQRSRELASLQMGLLTTVLQTLSMRDPMTARHSAAVARYSRETARLMGLSDAEQDLIHSAALLHDIGKFIFPDSILFAERKLTDDEWETVKMHPEQGARLVRRIDGYGPVADIIYCHHERFDGNGYYKIALNEIPLDSRIIAAADTYDVMTSRDSYRRPVSSEAALAELRRVAGSQLDPAVVDVFETLILERGIGFRHTDAADFEIELAFDKRVADYARPRLTAA
jgi:putative nucleotidyltransferase with HDIG domain